MKKLPVFTTEIKSSHKLLFSCKDLRSRSFCQKNDSPLKFLANLHEKEIQKLLKYNIAATVVLSI